MHQRVTAMSRFPAEKNLSGLQTILNCLMQSIRRYRQQQRDRQELATCSVAEISSIARDLRLTPRELMRLVNQETKATAALHELLAVLGIDAKCLRLNDPGIMLELERRCSTCSHKPQCAYHLDHGTSFEHYREYCPNTEILDDLTTMKPAAWRGRGVENLARRQVNRL
jgi:hypothetical protein